MVVHLIKTRRAEELGSIDVDGDLVTGGGGVVRGVVKAGNGSAGEAGVEPGAPAAAGGAAGDLPGFAVDLRASKGRAAAEAAVEGAEATTPGGAAA